jgi:hypothetical protein
MCMGTAVAQFGTAMTYPNCAICGEPLTSERDPMCDDGACYHRLCMLKATAGDAAGASDEVTAR